MSNPVQAKNFGYSDFNQNQNQSPESTRFTSPLNQPDAYHIGNNSELHDTFVWSTEEQSSLVIPIVQASTADVAAVSIPADLNGVLQNESSSLLTQYFDSTLATTSNIVAPVPIASEPQAASQGDIDSLISGGSVFSE